MGVISEGRPCIAISCKAYASRPPALMPVKPTASEIANLSCLHVPVRMQAAWRHDAKLKSQAESMKMLLRLDATHTPHLELMAQADHWARPGLEHPGSAASAGP